MKITCLDQDGKRQFRRSYDIDRIAVDLPNNADFLALQRELRSHENDNTIHSLNTEIFHDQLKNLQVADNNVYWGHVTNTTQSIYGEKYFYDYIRFVDTFKAAGLSNIISSVDTIYGYDVTGAGSELEIADGLSFGEEMVRLTAGLTEGGGSGNLSLLTTFITYNVTGAGFGGNVYQIKIDTTDTMTYTGLNGTHAGVFVSLTGNVNIPRGIAYYTNVTSFVSNYAFYGANGNIYNNGDVDITGVYKISGVTISGGNVFTMFENTFLSNNYFQGVSASTLIVSDITATNVSTSYFNTTHITTSNILSTNSSITYQSSTNLLTTYLSTAYLSTTNFLTTYLTATNLYTSEITTTGNIYCGASLTAVQTLIAKNGIQMDSAEYIGYGTTGAAPTGGLSFNTSNNATFSGSGAFGGAIECQTNIILTRTTSQPYVWIRLYGAGGTAVASGQTMGGVRFGAWNGSAYSDASSSIVGVTVGLQSATNAGGELRFNTTAQGTTAGASRWAIRNDGNLEPYTTGTYSLGTSTYRVYNGYFSNDIFTPMISSTNILTTYLTSTNIYTSYITSTSIYATNATITNISASNVLSTNSSITYQSSTNLLTTYLSTAYLSTTNFLTTYLTATNIYTSTLTATSNVSISGKLTASSATFGTATDYTNFEADGTMVMYGSATVYNDLQYAISSGRVGVANFPDWATFNTDFGEYKFDIDDYIDLGSQEIPHSWEEGTEIEFHVHWANSGKEVVDTDIAWKLYWTFAKMGSVFSTTQSATGITSLLTTHTTLTHFYTTVGTTTLSTATIGTQLKLRLKRVMGYDAESTYEPFALQVGVHYRANTIGSRTTSSK